MPVRFNHDRITVDGKLVAAKEKIYFMMNKPRGIVTTASDEKGRDTVYTILNNAKQQHANTPWIAQSAASTKRARACFC